MAEAKMNGLLFPGQGSQTVGMGLELYNALPSARVLLDKADTILGYSLKDLMFNGPAEQLTDTKYAQPAIYTCSAMYLEKIKELGIDYNYVAGHSLGEYDALLAANVFDFETGLRLVAARGEAMSKMNGQGTMAAVMGLSEDELATFMVPGAVMANLNSKTQIVISGTEEAVDAVGEKLSDREDIKFKKLRVSAAFHSPQMEEAAKTMKDIIEAAEMRKPTCYVISNVTGKPTMDLAEIKTNLISQITGQVRWCDTILAMKEAGVTMLYEVGYGDVLKKMNKTITFRPKCVGVDI
jgi:[acyl-carrier-protein] S-malonyltransferase